jgi:hypothetical protein
MKVVVTVIQYSSICREIFFLKAIICREIEIMKTNESSLFVGFSYVEIFILKNIFIYVGLVQNCMR